MAISKKAAFAPIWSGMAALLFIMGFVPSNAPVSVDAASTQTQADAFTYAPQHQLTVTTTGTGSGSVNANPAPAEGEGEGQAVLVVNSVTPDWAWLFGGVKAVIAGQGFHLNASVAIGGQPVQPVSVTPTSMGIIVPPLEDTGNGDEANFSKIVEVTNPPGGKADVDTTTFTYKRYETTEGVTTTAFYVEDENPINLALDDNLGAARLTLPPPPSKTVPALAFGLASATKSPSKILANLIDAGPDSSVINGVWDFAVHLYDTEVSSGAGAQPAGTPVYNEIEWTYARPPEGTTAATLEFPVNDTNPALTATEVKTGLSVWALATHYDYVADKTTVNTGSTGATSAVAYESTLVGNEVMPAVTDTTPDDAAIDQVTARLYDLSAFSLRLNADNPDWLATLKDGSAYVVSGSTSGTTQGGTPLTITSAAGGLAWVEVGFGKYEALSKAPQPLSDFTQATITNAGQDEFNVQLQTPKYSKAESVDIAIYLRSDLANPIVVLKDKFTYKASNTIDLTSLWFVLLGLLAALIGLAAGGHSGGGGGGVCFIATAAYGTPLAADIDALRALRDACLLNNAAGTAFVDAYYHASPMIADVIAKSPVLAGIVRVLLVPVVLAARMILAMPAVSVFLAAATVALCMMRSRFRRRKSE